MWRKAQAKVFVTCTAFVLLASSLNSFAQGTSDRQGRADGERRVEHSQARANERGQSGSGGARQGGSQAMRDTQAKVQRGAAAVLRGERRTYSGPTQRLSRSVRERSQRVIASPRAGASRSRK